MVAPQGSSFDKIIISQKLCGAPPLISPLYLNSEQDAFQNTKGHPLGSPELQRPIKTFIEQMPYFSLAWSSRGTVILAK
jgi:hypothetical protein